MNKEVFFITQLHVRVSSNSKMQTFIDKTPSIDSHDNGFPGETYTLLKNHFLWLLNWSVHLWRNNHQVINLRLRYKKKMTRSTCTLVSQWKKYVQSYWFRFGIFSCNADKTNSCIIKTYKILCVLKYVSVSCSFYAIAFQG